MSRGILSRMIEDGKRSADEVRAESYVMVNVRPGEKVAALLDLLSRLTGKSPSALVAEKLSEALADSAASSAAHGPAILDAAASAIKQDAYLNDGCALQFLEKRGVIKVSNVRLEKILKSAFDTPKAPARGRGD
jgi:hypothetical protein